jgi:hypothetical protein
MEQLQEIRKKQYERYNNQRNEEKQQKSNIEHINIQTIEEIKDHLKEIGYKIHHYKNINDLAKNIEKVRETLDTNMNKFQEYDLDDVKETFNRIMIHMQNQIIKFTAISNMERYNMQKIQTDIKKILQLLNLSVDIIEFDVQMDTTEDENIAKQLLFDEHPMIDLPSILAEQLTNIFTSNIVKKNKFV